MRPSDCLNVGWQTLRVNTGRSLLTTLGVVVGVAAVICTMSIGAGAEDEVAETLRTLGANLLSVTPGAANAHGVRMEAGGRRSLTEGDAAAIRRELPEIEIAAPLVSKRLQVIAGSRNWSTLVAGVTPDYLNAREWSAAEGRLFDSADLDFGAKVAIVGSDVASALFDARPAVGETIRIGKVPATIIAVLSPKGAGAAGRSQDDVVFVPLSMAKSRLLGAANIGTRGALDLISVKVVDSAELPEAKSQIETLLRPGGRRHQHPDHHARFCRRTDARIRIANGGRRLPPRSRPATARRNGRARLGGRTRRIFAGDRGIARRRLASRMARLDLTAQRGARLGVGRRGRTYIRTLSCVPGLAPRSCRGPARRMTRIFATPGPIASGSPVPMHRLPKGRL